MTSYVGVGKSNYVLTEKNFCSRWSEKKVLSTLSDFALKILSLYSLTKFFFNIVKDLFKSYDVLRRSGKVQLSSNGRIFVPGGLRKKYLARCQILRSKYYLYTVYQKVFFNIVKDSFKSCDVLRRSGKVQLSSNGKRIFVPSGLRKKYLARCQILRSKYYLYTV